MGRFSASCAFVCLIMGASTAAAQTYKPPASIGGKKAESTAPVSDVDSKASLTFDLKLAPVWSDNLRASSGDRLSDYQTSEASINYTSAAKTPDGKARALVFSGSLSFQVGTDFDQDSGDETPSAIAGSAKLNWKPAGRSFSPFASYSLEADFDGVLRKHLFTDQAFGAGVDVSLLKLNRCDVSGSHCDTPALALAATPAVERVFSSLDPRDRWTLKFSLAANGEFVWPITWKLSAELQRRMFDERDANGVQAEWRFISAAGLDFAKLVEPDKRILRELSIGLRYSGVRREFAANKSNLSVLPILRLRLATR